jgi:hypothetical protein
LINHLSKLNHTFDNVDDLQYHIDNFYKKDEEKQKSGEEDIKTEDLKKSATEHGEEQIRKEKEKDDLEFSRHLQQQEELRLKQAQTPS